MNELRNVPIGAPVEKCPLIPDFTFDDRAIDPPQLDHSIVDVPPPLLRHSVEVIDSCPTGVPEDAT